MCESTYLAGSRMGPAVESKFLRSLADYDVALPGTKEWKRIDELVDRYADFPLGGTDASVVALAEKLDTDLVITFDRRHFETVKPRHVKALRLLP